MEPSAVEPFTTTERVPEKRKLEGIEGWLVFFGISLVLGSVRSVITMGTYYLQGGTATAFDRLPLAMNGELSLNAAYMAILLFTLIAFFTKKR
jgi:hypothetical protein